MVSHLGIYASQISGHLTPATSYDSIATATGSGNPSSITFSSIPSTYKHLQIRAMAFSAGGNGCRMTFNGDTSANYSEHSLDGNGASAAAYGNTNLSYIWSVGQYNGLTASNPSVSVIDILDYQNSNKYKTSRELDGQDNNGSGFVSLISGSWRSTSAITSITFTLNSGTFGTNTHFALYGIRG